MSIPCCACSSNRTPVISTACNSTFTLRMWTIQKKRLEKTVLGRVVSYKRSHKAVKNIIKLPVTIDKGFS